jgi:predicted DsbA family dithiol-disulfide isomerase
MDVEIWSDIACPWCFIGKRRFEAALAGFEHRDEVRVTWRSFELDPSAPPERVGDRAAHLAEKYGSSVEQARSMEDQMTQVAAGEGLEFRFDLARAGNTFDAHRIVHLAHAHGRQDAMKERLQRAYLGEGELISDPETAARTGSSLGINGVPFFVVDRAFGASGAQSPEILRSLLERGWEARVTLPA